MEYFLNVLFTKNVGNDEVIVYPFRVLLYFFLRKLPRNFQGCYYSCTHKSWSNTWTEYHYSLGKNEGTVEAIRRLPLLTKTPILRAWGYSSFQVAQRIASQDTFHTCAVVIFNHNPEVLLDIFNRIPGFDVKLATEDLIFIECNSLEKANQLAAAIPDSAGEVEVFQRGTLV